jgi:hypothetical protein
VVAGGDEGADEVATEVDKGFGGSADDENAHRFDHLKVVTALVYGIRSCSSKSIFNGRCPSELSSGAFFNVLPIGWINR